MAEIAANEPTIIKTAFPGLQEAAGVKPENMEVVKAGEQSATPATETPAAPTEKAKIDVDSLSDEDLDALMKKRFGKSLSEINPPKEKSPEEIAKEKEQRKNEALAWALTNDKLKKEDYDRVASERGKTDRELALKTFASSLMAEDKDITFEEAEEIFKDTYHELQDEDSKLYAIGQKEIKKLAESYRKETFAPVDSIEQEYDNVIQSQNQYKAYKGQIKTLTSELPKELSFEVSHKDVDGKESPITYKIPMDDKVLAKLTAEFGSENSFVIRNVSSNGKIDEKALSKDINDRMKALMYDNVIPALLKQHGEEVEKRMIVIMGNKRVGGPQLNNGHQVIGDDGKPKANNYPALNEAVSKQKY